jgi:hypothetical protein
MSDLELIDAVAHVTGEDAHEIRRRGFMNRSRRSSQTTDGRVCWLKRPQTSRCSRRNCSSSRRRGSQ